MRWWNLGESIRCFAISFTFDVIDGSPREWPVYDNAFKSRNLKVISCDAAPTYTPKHANSLLIRFCFPVFASLSSCRCWCNSSCFVCFASRMLSVGLIFWQTLTDQRPQCRLSDCTRRVKWRISNALAFLLVANYLWCWFEWKIFWFVFPNGGNQGRQMCMFSGNFSL